MGIFDGLFGNSSPRSTDVSKSAYHNNPEVEELLKSLAKSKGQNNTNVIDSLDVGAFDRSPQKSNKGSFEESSPEAIIKYKQQLNMWANTIIVQAIIRTRINQVATYLRPARLNNTGLGFQIVPKDGSLATDKQHSKKVAEIEAFIQNTGKESQPQRDTFVEFTKKFIYDQYTYDQVNVELVRGSRSKQLDHFNILDASSILIKDVPKSIDSPRVFGQYNRNGLLMNTFTEDEMTFYVSNPRTDMALKGYGNSAVEAAIPHLHYYQNTESFNAKFFEQGGTTKGILLINYGDQGATSSQASLQALKQQWQAQFSGTNGAWRIPVLTGQDAKFVNMSQSSKDMEFEKWLNYLLNIICSVFTIAPEEVNFPNRGGSTGHGAGNSINEGNTMKSKMESSKDKGLKPLLQSIEDFMNRFIVSRYDDNYVFKFSLGDSTSEKEKLEILQLKLQSGMTLNEARHEMGLPDLPSLEEIFDNAGNVFGNAGTAVNLLTLGANIRAQEEEDKASEANEEEYDVNRGKRRKKPKDKSGILSSHDGDTGNKKDLDQQKDNSNIGKAKTKIKSNLDTNPDN